MRSCLCQWRRTGPCWQCVCVCPCPVRMWAYFPLCVYVCEALFNYICGVPKTGSPLHVALSGPLWSFHRHHATLMTRSSICFMCLLIVNTNIKKHCSVFWWCDSRSSLTLKKPARQSVSLVSPVSHVSHRIKLNSFFRSFIFLSAKIRCSNNRSEDRMML